MRNPLSNIHTSSVYISWIRHLTISSSDVLICFITLGVRSLANASRARQFNPLNPPGVGWVPLPQTNMAAVVGRAWSVVRGRACVVVRGRARSVVVVRSCRSARFAASTASTAVTRTNEGRNERTNEQHIITP